MLLSGDIKPGNKRVNKWWLTLTNYLVVVVTVNTGKSAF